MLFHYFISKIRFGFAKHTYSLIFTLKIGWKHAWTAKLYRFRGLFYALNCRKCYCIEADSNMPSYHVFFAIFTSFVSFWTYPSLTNRHSPTPCPHCTPAQPTLATWRQLNVELLHRVWVSATQQCLIWMREMGKWENEKSVKQLCRICLQW